MFYYKLHKSKLGYLLAACDKSICDKKINNKNIEFHVNPRFYKDKSATEAQMKKMFSMANSANIIGKKIVQLAMDLDLIDKEMVIDIGGIPHAQMIVAQG